MSNPNPKLFVIATPTFKNDEHYPVCIDCAAQMHHIECITSYWAVDGEYICEYCCDTSTVAEQQKIRAQAPYKLFRAWKPIYRVCDRCRRAHQLNLSDYIKRAIDAFDTRCDCCNQLPLEDTPTKFESMRTRQANGYAKYINSHGISAHTTLTGLIRAMDHYTYRDDNNMLCSAFDWVTLDPMNGQSIREFLGY